MLSLNVLDDNTTGIVLYEGLSSYDNKPIVAIATLKTSNRKTGDLIQTWILRSDVNPVEAVKTQADSSICGSCIHRGTYSSIESKMMNRSCYVNVGQAPLGIYKAYQRGNYRKGLTDEQLATTLSGRLVRLGSYGDPAVLPYEICEKLVKFSVGNTGYTHMWKLCDPRYSNLLMASCDTEADFEEAHKRGWRTFRVRGEGDLLLPGEFECPASTAQNNRLTCEQCLACSGTRSGKLGNRAGNVAIVVHGSAAKVNSFKRAESTRLLLGGGITFTSVKPSEGSALHIVGDTTDGIEPQYNKTRLTRNDSTEREFIKFQPT